MIITLTPEHERLIAQAIQSGGYRTPEEVIEHALDALRDDEIWLRDNRDVISEKIERAFAQFERGEFFSAGESQADMTTRKAAWRAGHSR